MKEENNSVPEVQRTPEKPANPPPPSVKQTLLMFFVVVPVILGFPFLVYACAWAFASACAFVSVPCESFMTAGFFGFLGACAIYFASLVFVSVVVKS